MPLLLLLFALAMAEPQPEGRCINCIPYQDSLREVANTIAVFDLEPIAISEDDAFLVSAKIQSDLVKLGLFRVIERSQLFQILEEQELQVSSSISRVVEVGRIAGAKKAVMGRAGKINDEYFYSLKFVNVETGEVVSSNFITVPGSFSDFLDASNYAVRDLLGKAGAKATTAKIRNPKPIAVYQHTEKVLVEQHVFHHQGEKKAGFIPCSFCQGRGVAMQKINARMVEADCPYCSSSIMYSGSETGYQRMTGRWVK